MIARTLGASLLCVVMCGAAFALRRDRTIAQFHHTAWTAKDGAPSQITALAQTTDGYLWIGTARGIFRFDGVRFERYTPPADVVLPSQNIYTLAATPDGGLWISFRSRGLGFLKDGRLTIFNRPDLIPRSWVYFFASDGDGRLWAGTFEGLALRTGSRWLEIDADWNVERGRVWSMFVDRDGTLWTAIGDKLWFVRRGSRRFEIAGTFPSGVRRIAQSADGTIWIAERARSTRPLHAAASAGLGWNSQDILFDLDGALWSTAAPFGLRRIRFPERAMNRFAGVDDPAIDAYHEHDGLSSDLPQLLLEDREGNVWVGTSKGLDRFRASRVIPVSMPPGHDQMTLLAGADGDLWAGSASSETLVHVRGDDITVQPIHFACSVYRAPNGDIWWGGHGVICRQRGERIEEFAQPKELRPANGDYDWMWEVVGDGDDALWVRAGDLGLVHFKDGVWSRSPPPAGLLASGPSATYRDTNGRTWFGYSIGRADLLDHGRVTQYGRRDGLDIGRIKVIRQRGAEVWLGGESGLALFHDGRFRTVMTGTVSGIIAAADGTLWLNELRGIVRITPEEVRRIVADPRHHAEYQLIDYLDGMPGAPQMNWTVSTAVQTTDGRLWFATDSGLARIDPATWRTNTVPPPVSILGMTADREYPPAANVRFPVGTERLQIRYTALSLSIPERVRFRYKLEGVDRQWQDAGTRREAFYTNLRPGRYTFRVKAANDDGVWNESGAAIGFEVAPAFFQTRWFLALCVAFAAGIVVIAYVLRLRQMSARLQRLYEERIDERMRIARELHDTLLQGFLSASMQLHLAADQLSDDSSARPILTNVIRLVSDVSEEGRQAVRGLRVSERAESLEEAFSRAKGEIGDRRDIAFRVLVEGQPRALQPLVRDEIYRIGREALVNAFKHAEARNIEVELEYLDRCLRLHVRDDGRGIDPAAPRDDRWGLAGMKERAAKIGAKCNVFSRSGAGTEIELSVPGHVAYVRR